MKLTIIERREIEAKYLTISVAVRYEDEDMPYDAPLRQRNIWVATIDLDAHTIRNWPQGKTLNFDMKVCDQGTYVLLDENWNDVRRLEDEYVPNSLLPGRYGDYLTLDIDETGKITNWKDDANLSDFEEGRS